MHVLLRRIKLQRSVFLWLGSILALGFVSTTVFAHAKLLRSQPAANATLRQAPNKVELWFSEDLEAQFSTIIVMDQNGKHFDKDDVSLAEENKKLQIGLDELGSGTYTVEWKALSTDQHTMKGKFTFTITLVEPSSSGAQAIQPQEGPWTFAPTTPVQTGKPVASDTSGSMQESGSSWAQSLVRWLQYLGMMMLLGGFAFHQFVLLPALAKTRSLSDGERARAMGASAGAVVLYSWLSLALLVIASFSELVLQASTVFDKSITEAMSPTLLNRVITQTGFGKAWRLQMLAVVALLVVVFLLSRRTKQNPANDHKTFWWIGLLASGVLLVAPTWTGHAAAAAKEFPFAKTNDWLHLVAAGIWVGGLFHLALTMPKAVSGPDRRGRLHLFHSVIPIFTRLAIASTILIVLTGVYNSLMHIDRFGELWSTPYGKTLLVKVLLVVPMLLLGGVNTFIIHPRASRLIEKEEIDSTNTPTYLDRSFSRSVTIEAGLGVMVLLVASILVFLQPAREHAPGQVPAMTTEAPRLANR